NECEICQAITEGRLNDVIEIDAASNNGVEEIRDIRDKARYAPTQAEYKIYIIDEVHMLSTGAFHALLKTLEEPPEYVISLDLNECEILHAIDDGRLNDVIEIDAASNYGLEEIRDIRDIARYAPTQAEYKIYIIDEVHMLSTGAFNALLKTLEEPPENVIF